MMVVTVESTCLLCSWVFTEKQKTTSRHFVVFSGDGPGGKVGTTIGFIGETICWGSKGIGGGRYRGSGDKEGSFSISISSSRGFNSSLGFSISIFTGSTATSSLSACADLNDSLSLLPYDGLCLGVGTFAGFGGEAVVIGAGGVEGTFRGRGSDLELSDSSSTGVRALGYSSYCPSCCGAGGDGGGG